MDQPIRYQLIDFLRTSTKDGLFPLVAYGLKGDSLTLLTSTIRDLALAIKILEEVTHQDYNLGRFVSDSMVTRLASENPHVFFRNHREIRALGNQDLASLGRLIGVFGAPFYKTKAFCLVDICGFSKLGYAEQLASLYSLNTIFWQARSRAKRFCDRLGTQPVFLKTSTGDGFYAWSNAIGGNSDVAVFMFLLAILERAERSELDGFRLKGAFIIDSAFLLFDPEGDVPEYPQSVNAVGAATNGAARLMAAAKPKQLLVADFDFRGQGEERFTPASLLRQANELFRVEGGAAGTLALSPEKLLKVVDKHGEGWYCWNVYGDVPSSERTARSKLGLRPDNAQDIAELSFRA